MVSFTFPRLRGRKNQLNVGMPASDEFRGASTGRWGRGEGGQRSQRRTRRETRLKRMWGVFFPCQQLFLLVGIGRGLRFTIYPPSSQQHGVFLHFGHSFLTSAFSGLAFWSGLGGAALAEASLVIGLLGCGLAFLRIKPCGS